MKIFSEKALRFVNFKMSFWSENFFQKTNEIFLDFCPEIFCSFLEASWKLLGLPGDLVSNIINREAYRKPKKLPGSPQEAIKIAGKKSRNIFVGILDETDFSSGHFEINWPLAGNYQTAPTCFFFVFSGHLKKLFH